VAGAVQQAELVPGLDLEVLMGMVDELEVDGDGVGFRGGVAAVRVVVDLPRVAADGELLGG
jgi:hypothetical protein